MVAENRAVSQRELSSVPWRIHKVLYSKIVRIQRKVRKGSFIYIEPRNVLQGAAQSAPFVSLRVGLRSTSNHVSVYIDSVLRLPVMRKITFVALETQAKFLGGCFLS